MTDFRPGGLRPRCAIDVGTNHPKEVAWRHQFSKEPTEEATGNMLGAFVAAMLYDTVGPALLATLEPDHFQSTLQLNVNFLRPVRPGRVVGRGRIVHRDGDLVFLEASLIDSHETLIAVATATAQVIAIDQARSAA